MYYELFKKKKETLYTFSVTSNIANVANSNVGTYQGGISKNSPDDYGISGEMFMVPSVVSVYEYIR